MYQLIETSYLATEHGYYDKVKLKLRATPRQMQNYDTAILPAIIINIIWTMSYYLYDRLWLRINWGLTKE